MSGTLVSFQANGRTCDGYLSVPDSGGGPAVIVLQEWWGLVDHIKDVADRFANSGFTALAPDLYHGESTTQPDDAGRFMMALNIGETEKDLAGAVKFLVDHNSVSSDKVGTIGFCMGGQLSLFAACANPQIGACIDFYGIHPNIQPDFKNLAAPVLGIFAENDEFVTPGNVDELKVLLESQGHEPDFHIYPGVNHAFFNDSRPDVYDVQTATDAWEKVTTFFGENL